LEYQRINPQHIDHYPANYTKLTISTGGNASFIMISEGWGSSLFQAGTTVHSHSNSRNDPAKLSHDQPRSINQYVTSTSEVCQDGLARPPTVSPQHQLCCFAVSTAPG